jgi:F-type H+-transporting ATPase subunit b
MMGLFADAEFWVLIAFVVAFGILAWKATPILTGALDQRARKIKAELDEAERLRQEAERTLAEFERRKREAMNEANEIVAHAKAEAEREAARAEAALKAALERRRQMARETIALEEQKAVLEVRNAAIEIAIAAVRRALSEDLAPARRTSLMDEAIAALPRALA